MHNMTHEQRKAAAAKGHATRRARREAIVAARLDALIYADGLREQINALEKRLAVLKQIERVAPISAALTGDVLLRPDEIAAAAFPWSGASGVYFLLRGNDVVYVGKSSNVYARIAEHRDKVFDRYAFVPCHVDDLEVLESLYIHCLRPVLNGDHRNGAKAAPLALSELIARSATKA